MDASLVATGRRQRQRREIAVTASLVLLALALAALFISVGDYPVPLDGVIRSLFSPFTGATDSGNDFIVLELRLPRVLTALCAGAAFGLGGHIFQTVLRNPLASPDIIGIAAGAGAAAVTAILVFDLTGLPVSLAALGGAVATAMVTYLLAWRQGVSGYRLVLIGISMGAILHAVTSFLFTRARINDVQQALAWLVGSLNGASFANLVPLVIAMAVLVPAAILLERPLATLQLGDDSARALGTRVELARVGLLLTGVALVAFATAAVGPISFVSFTAGPIARRLVGPNGSGFYAAALVGGLVTVGADLVAQFAFGANQLPVGVVTGGFGALFLIWLLIVSNRSGRGG
jgi:iron complex transport system permease protein